VAVANRSIARAGGKAAPSLRILPVLLIAGAAIVVIGLLQVVQTSEATTASFAIQRLEQRRLELEASVRGLEADVAALSSLERIERESRRLGLVTPVAQETIEVNVPLAEQDENLLPSRFTVAGQEEAEENGSAGGSSWWESLLDLLPFR
jgi:hypothetical protein